MSSSFVIQLYECCVRAGKSEQLVAIRRILVLVAGNRPIVRTQALGHGRGRVPGAAVNGVAARVHAGQEELVLHPPTDLPPRTSRRNSRRLLPLASAIVAAGLIGGIMIMVDASGSAGFPAGDAPRTWHAQPAELATHSQVMEDVGSSVSSTVSPATGKVRASTPMAQAGERKSTSLNARH